MEKIFPKSCSMSLFYLSIISVPITVQQPVHHRLQAGYIAIIVTAPAIIFCVACRPNQERTEVYSDTTGHPAQSGR